MSFKKKMRSKFHTNFVFSFYSDLNVHLFIVANLAWVPPIHIWILRTEFPANLEPLFASVTFFNQKLHSTCRCLCAFSDKKNNNFDQPKNHILFCKNVLLDFNPKFLFVRYDFLLIFVNYGALWWDSILMPKSVHVFNLIKRNEIKKKCDKKEDKNNNKNNNKSQSCWA